jgi:hypothetical protein
VINLPYPKPTLKNNRMAIMIDTKDPEGLLNLIYNEIDEENIRTWGRIGKSQQLTHITSSGQYEYLASFSPKKSAGIDKLVFLINFPADTDRNRVRGLYAIYHGRFVEMLLGHFYRHFSSLAVPSKPQLYDVMTPEIRAVLNK